MLRNGGESCARQQGVGDFAQSRKRLMLLRTHIKHDGVPVQAKKRVIAQMR
jgi:hypothetical protein